MCVSVCVCMYDFNLIMSYFAYVVSFFVCLPACLPAGLQEHRQSVTTQQECKQNASNSNKAWMLSSSVLGSNVSAIWWLHMMASHDGIIWWHHTMASHYAIIWGHHMRASYVVLLKNKLNGVAVRAREALKAVFCTEHGSNGPTPRSPNPRKCTKNL